MQRIKFQLMRRRARTERRFIPTGYVLRFLFLASFALKGFFACLDYLINFDGCLCTGNAFGTFLVVAVTREFLYKILFFPIAIMKRSEHDISAFRLENMLTNFILIMVSIAPVRVGANQLAILVKIVYVAVIRLNHDILIIEKQRKHEATAGKKNRQGQQENR